MLFLIWGQTLRSNQNTKKKTTKQQQQLKIKE